eukprot:42769-Hanusia_phi.AAC.1
MIFKHQGLGGFWRTRNVIFVASRLHLLRFKSSSLSSLRVRFGAGDGQDGMRVRVGQHLLYVLLSLQLRQFESFIVRARITWPRRVDLMILIKEEEEDDDKMII